MDEFVFVEATKEQARLRLALTGPPGSGKTYTALNIAKHFPGPVAVIDTEHGSASKYAHLFKFKTLRLTDFSPEKYVAAIRAAEAAGFKTLIIDSLSHAWAGKNGALEQVDRLGAASRGGKFQGGWGKVTPMQNAMIEAIVGSSMHVIATMRTKMAYDIQQAGDGKTKPVKLGLAPVQREGVEYEFDVVIDMTQDNAGVVTKTRCPELNEGVFPKPGRDVADTLLKWLTDGSPAEEPKAEDVMARLREDILRAADNLGYDDKKVDKWINGKYELKGGLNDGGLAESDLRDIHRIFVQQASQKRTA